MKESSSIILCNNQKAEGKFLLFCDVIHSMHFTLMLLVISLSIVYLRYANRAKNIKNKPHINEDPKDALLREFQEEIARYLFCLLLSQLHENLVEMLALVNE